MKISIITVCKNPGDALKKTVESVLAQSYTDIEYIIIDSASTDGTVEYLEEINSPGFQPPSLSKREGPGGSFKFLSEPDTGIYNAMNKGAGLATGEIIYFLNAGDMLFGDDVIENVANEFVQSGADFIYTDIFYEDGNSGYVKKFNRVDRYFLIRDCISHQSSFYKRDIFEMIGNFDESYKLAADYDFLLAIWNDNKIQKKYFNIVAAFYDLKGVSSFSRKDVIEERKSIQEKRFSLTERVVYGWFFYQFIRRRLRKAGFKIYG